MGWREGVLSAFPFAAQNFSGSALPSLSLWAFLETPAWLVRGTHEPTLSLSHLFGRGQVWSFSCS